MSTRIIYLRSANGAAIGCVAFDSSKTSSVLKYQVSIQNPRDKFSRSLARQIALGRLIESPFSLDAVQEGTIHDVVSKIMKDITQTEGTKTFPARAVSAAKLWLKSNKRD
jgi:hypothetical protein